MHIFSWPCMHCCSASMRSMKTTFIYSNKAFMDVAKLSHKPVASLNHAMSKSEEIESDLRETFWKA